ncbi:MAG: hypothetical protein AAFY76_20250, partial [Cyanobacteria bacterium J06649_11]
MALSFIRFLEVDNNRYQFAVDIGTNRFYIYTIGDKEVLSNKGLKKIKNPSYISNLIGPLPKSNLGRTILEIPSEVFDRNNRYIQITSFRTEKRIGPAISEIINIIPISNNTFPPPVISFGMEKRMENQPLETVPFSYRETKPISSAMFLGALTSLIPKVLPTVKKALPVVSELLPTALPVLGNLVGAVAGNNGTNEDGSESRQGGISQLIQTATNPETAQLIASLLQQVGNNTLTSNTVPNVLPNPKPSQPVAQVRKPVKTIARGKSPLQPPPKSSSGRKPVRNTKRKISRSRDISANFSVYPPISQEMAVPAALLSALPSLMPLLQQVLTPDTIKTFMENMPTNKLMGTVTEGLKQVGGMIQESEKRTLDHLEKMMPNHTDSREINDLF